MANNDYSKLVQFFTGSALPVNPIENGLYFITSTVDGQHEGKLYKGSTLIAETRDVARITALENAVNQFKSDVSSTYATKKELTDHIALYEALLEIVQGDVQRLDTVLKDAVDLKTFKSVEDKFAAILNNASLDSFDDVAKSIASTQAEVDTLEAYVGTLPEKDDDGAALPVDNVIDYIEYRTQDIASGTALSAITERITQAEKDIDAIEADYLKAADKTELSTAITTEENRAKGVESGLDTRIKAIEDDYLVEADKTELSNLITDHKTILDAVKEDVDYFFKDAGFDDPDTAKAYKDTLKEIQDYIDSDTQDAADLLAGLNDVKDRMTTAEGEIDTLQTEMDAVEKLAAENAAAVATKASQADLDAVEGRMDTAESDIDALEGRATALEGKVGEKAVNVQISEAIDALDIETYAKQADLTAEVNRATGVENTLIAALSWQNC